MSLQFAVTIEVEEIAAEATEGATTPTEETEEVLQIQTNRIQEVRDTSQCPHGTRARPTGFMLTRLTNASPPQLAL